MNRPYSVAEATEYVVRENTEQATDEALAGPLSDGWTRGTVFGLTYEETEERVDVLEMSLWEHLNDATLDIRAFKPPWHRRPSGIT
jgi:hypothetical protein